MDFAAVLNHHAFDTTHLTIEFPNLEREDEVKQS
jgi:hypothetical protein